MAARKKKPTTEIANIEEQIRQQAAMVTDSTGSASDRLRITQSKEFLAPDGTKTRGPIETVIVDFNSMNALFPKVFDKENPEPPTCYAMTTPASLGGPSSMPKNMVPSPNAPEIKGTMCTGCPLNEFNTAINGGAGKACKNTRVLAIVNPDATTDESNPVLLLSVSPGAIKRYDAYVNILASQGQIPTSVVTEISFDPNVDHSSLVFRNAGPNKNLAAHFARQREAQELLMREPDLSAAPATTKRAPRKASKAKSTRRSA